MKRNFILADGRPYPSSSPRVIQPDHTVSTFTVSIRHMGNISTNSIKRLLQQRHEVVAIERTEETIVVREARSV